MAVRPLLAPLALASVLILPACDNSPTAAIDCIGGAAIAVGDEVTGTLEDGDELDIDGSFLDRYSLSVAAPGAIQVTMRSEEMDSFLWLINSSNGTVVDASDDDGGGPQGLDAQITRTVDRGCYWVEATTFPDETGAYTLSIHEV